MFIFFQLSVYSWARWYKIALWRYLSFASFTSELTFFFFKFYYPTMHNANLMFFLIYSSISVKLLINYVPHPLSFSSDVIYHNTLILCHKEPRSKPNMNLSSGKKGQIQSSFFRHIPEKHGFYFLIPKFPNEQTIFHTNLMRHVNLVILFHLAPSSML